MGRFASLIGMLSIAATLMACGNIEADTTQTPQAEFGNAQGNSTLSIISAKGLQTGTRENVFRYDQSVTDPYGFFSRYVPARALQTVPNEEIFDAFMKMPHSTYANNDIRITFRDHSNVAGCLFFTDAFQRVLDNDTYNSFSNPYPGVFVHNCKTMRFGTNVFFGPVTGVVSRRTTKEIIGYIEQSHTNWTGPSERIMVSSAGKGSEIRAKIIELSVPNTTQSLPESVVDESYVKQGAACRLTHKLNAKDILRSYEDAIMEVIADDIK